MLCHSGKLDDRSARRGRPVAKGPLYVFARAVRHGQPRRRSDPSSLPGLLCADPRQQRLRDGPATAVKRGEGRWSEPGARPADRARYKDRGFESSYPNHHWVAEPEAYDPSEHPKPPGRGRRLRPRLHTPSSMIITSVAALRRNAMSGWYSGAWYQFLIDAISGNSMMTTRLGLQSPSVFRVNPPL